MTACLDRWLRAPFPDLAALLACGEFLSLSEPDRWIAFAEFESIESFAANALLGAAQYERGARYEALLFAARRSARLVLRLRHEHMVAEEDALAGSG